jgi:hypothetical protein
MDFLTACNTVARQVDVPDVITSAQLDAQSNIEVRRIAHEVNRAFLYFYSALGDRERPQVVDALSIDTNQVTFLPSPTIDIDHLVDVIESTTRKQLQPRDYLTLYKDLNGPLNQVGSPDFYYVLAGRIGFAPMQNGPYTFLLSGPKKAARLTKATDVFPIPEEYVDCIVDHATGYLKKYHNDPDAENYIKRAIETFKTFQGVATAIAPQRRVITRIG